MISHSSQLREWLAELPLDRPGEAASAIAERVRSIRQSKASPRNRAELLEMMRVPAEQVLDPIEISLTGVALPLPEGPQRSYTAADRMLEQLSGGYEEVAKALAGRWIPLGSARRLEGPITQAIRFTSRKLALGYRVYLNGADPVWLKLHRLYALARGVGLSGEQPGAERTAERAYRDALLLALAEPTHFAAGQLNHVLRYIERHADLAELQPAERYQRIPSDPACFLVQVDQARAARSTVKWKPDSLAAGDLVLDCRRLVERMDAHLAALEQGVAPVKLGLPKAASEPQYLTLLRSLRNLWGQSPTRRFSRARFRPRADLVAGFPALWEYLSAQLVPPAAPARAPARQSEWAIRDESPEGFGLRYVAGDTGPLRVGELVAVRPRSTQDLKICIVRREASKRADALDLGVQLLSGHARPAAVTLRDASRPGIPDRREKVILLGALPSHGGVSGMLVPRDAVATGHRFSSHRDGERIVLRVGARLERMASCDLFALEAEAPERRLAAR